MENRQILVVENNQELSSVLVNQGYQVQITNSETITLEVAKQTQPYLIILNTTMANFDGYHLCKKLKAEAEISDIPVLLCSEEQSSAALVQAFEAGANEYLTFPFVIEELKARINNQLNLAQRYRQPSQGNTVLNSNTFKHFKYCLDRLPLPAWICDVQGNYIFLNQAWLNFIGKNLHLLNKPWGEAIHPQDKTNSKNQYLKAYQDLDKFKIEYRLKNGTGESRWFLDEGQPLFNLQGQFQGYIGFAVDITDKKINEITLAETKASLKKDDDKLKLFIKIIEYIRNPFNFEDSSQTVTSLLATTLKVNRCLLLNYDENLNPKVLPIAEYKDEGIQSALMSDFSIYNNYLSQPILIEDKAYQCKDVYQDQNLESFQPLAVDLKIKSLLMVRTSYKDKINGLLILHQIDNFRDWTEEEIELVELVAKQLGIAISNAKMVDSEKANSVAITKNHLQLQKEILDKQKIEQQLRDSEQRWQLAIKGTQDGIFDFDYKTGKVFYSDRWKSILGYEDQEISNSHEEWLKRIHPDDLQRVMEADKAHLERKNPYFREEYRLRCKNGTYKWILGRCQAVWDEQGKPVRLLGCHTDITERKKIEQAVKESENLYRQLIESQEGVMICRWLPDTSLTFVNECYAKFLGQSSQNLLGKSFYDCLSHRKGDNKLLLDHLHLLVTEKSFKTIEDQRVSWEGKTRYFRWLNQPILDAEGNLLEIQSHGVDISETKMREKALSLIAEGAAYSTGEDFCRTSLRYVTELLQVQFSYVAEIVESDNKIGHHWISWDGINYTENIQNTIPDLQGSPCEVTLKLGKYYVKDNLSNFHPQQSKIGELSIVSYWGVSLQDSKGNTIGLFGVMNSKPLEISAEQETILKIFAAKMGAELERQQSEQALKHLVQKEKLFSSISRDLIDEDFDTAINLAIKKIGEFFGADRCYIFQYQPLGWLTMTHEWCNEGLSTTMDLFQHFDLESYGLLLEDLLNNDLVYIKDYQAVPESWQKEKIFFRQKYLKSLLLLPMKNMGVTVGFIGLNTVDKSLVLTKEDLEHISLISNFLATVFESKTAESNLKASQQKLSFLVQQAPLAIIEMNHDKKIISWNPAAEDVFGYKDFEVINNNFITLLFPERLQEKITQLYLELFETRTRNYFVYENLTKEGNSIICQW